MHDPDEPTTPDTPGLTAEERRDERYRRRRAFLRRIGLPNARLTRGRRRKESDRRYYVRKLARKYGISETVAETLTPRHPNRGHHAMPARDSSGKFLPSTTKRAPVAPGHER